MIDAKWHSLVQEKLVLARALFSQLDERGENLLAVDREALRQGGVMLLNTARSLLLVHIARTYQQKVETVAGLSGLKELLGEDNAECQMIDSLRSQKGNWWQELDGWLAFYQRPRPEAPKQQPENIIAVAQDQGPDFSVENRSRVIQDMRGFLAEFSERHGEW